MGRAFRAFVGDAAGLIALGQEQAALIAAAFVATYVALERDEPAEAVDLVEGNPGMTFDGRLLTEALAAIPAKVFLGLKQGWELDKALAFGRFAAHRTALTETMDAARQEQQHQMQESEVVKGWRWVTRGRGSCAVCLARADGTVFPVKQPLTGHPACSCQQLPVVAGVRETVNVPTGEQVFRSLSKEEQERLVGPKWAELLDKGVPFSRLVKVERHKEWRPSITQRPAEEVA